MNEEVNEEVNEETPARDERTQALHRLLQIIIDFMVETEQY